MKQVLPNGNQVGNQEADPMMMTTEETPRTPSLTTSVVATVLAGFVDEQQLAGQVDKSTKTLARWRKTHKGPPWAVVGRKIYYSVEGVRRWLESGGTRTGQKRNGTRSGNGNGHGHGHGQQRARKSA
jgi:hypothetical protein